MFIYIQHPYKCKPVGHKRQGHIYFYKIGQFPEKNVMFGSNNAYKKCSFTYREPATLRGPREPHELYISYTEYTKADKGSLPQNTKKINKKAKSDTQYCQNPYFIVLQILDLKCFKCLLRV